MKNFPVVSSLPVPGSDPTVQSFLPAGWRGRIVSGAVKYQLLAGMLTNKHLSHQILLAQCWPGVPQTAWLNTGERGDSKCKICLGLSGRRREKIKRIVKDSEIKRGKLVIL